MWRSALVLRVLRCFGLETVRSGNLSALTPGTKRARTAPAFVGFPQEALKEADPPQLRPDATSPAVCPFSASVSPERHHALLQRHAAEPERDRQPLRPVRAQRGGGQAGDHGAQPGVRGGGGGEPERPAGHAAQPQKAVAHAPVHEAPEPGRPGGRLLPGAAAALLGGHLPLLRPGLPVPHREAPAGSGHVRLHLHDGDDDRGPLRGHLPPAAQPAAAHAARVHHDQLQLGVQPAAQLPAVLHLLPQRGPARFGRLRLLGSLRGAVGAARLHHLDHGGDLPGSGGRAGVLLRLHLQDDLEEPEGQNAQEGRGGRFGGGRQVRDPGQELRQQRLHHLPRQITHRQDDFRDRGGLRGVLGSVLHRSDVVRVGRNLLLARLGEPGGDAVRPAGQPQQLLQPLDLHDLQRPPAVGLPGPAALLPPAAGPAAAAELGQQHPAHHAAVPPAGAAPVRPQLHLQKLSAGHAAVLTADPPDRLASAQGAKGELGSVQTGNVHFPLWVQQHFSWRLC